MVKEPTLIPILQDFEDYAGIRYCYECINDDKLYGAFIIDVVPQCMNLHLHIFDPTLANLKLFKKEFQQVTTALANEYNFKVVFIIVPDEKKKLFKFIGNGTEKCVGTALDMPLYMIEVL